jgi:uncharacterized membrane protein HdeD (DUF308 family)
MSPIPSLTDKQLKVYEAVHRIRMSWVALIVTLTLFIAAFVVLVFAAFSQVVGPYVKGAFATIDGLLGACLHQVFRNLFPAKKAPKETP